MVKFQNPIIKGYNPDPSICRVEDDYYLVTSTFEFFPGVPIYHSKNLVDWTLINYCLTTDTQLPLEQCRCSGGIYAPTLRYHNEEFFMVTTNVSTEGKAGNFIVRAKDIRGTWSEPVWLDQPGIDPSLFWDDDGSVYLCSTHVDENSKVGGIGLYQLDPKSGERFSETKLISIGIGGRFPEAPHIYKKDDWYYLMIAEGGTEYGHMETIHRSKNIYGPYESCPHNPILSHKDRPLNPIQATGHGDLFCDHVGNWWMVCLGIRPLPTGLLHNLGRETFLSPVFWDAAGWPVVGNNGGIDLEMEGDLPAPYSSTPVDFEDDFSSEKMNVHWNYIRNPKRACYSLSGKSSSLCLDAGAEMLSDFSPTFLGIRQKEFDMTVSTSLECELREENACAGIAAFYNKDYYYAASVKREGKDYFAVLEKTIHGDSYVSSKKEILFNNQISFKIETGKTEYAFYYKINKEWEYLGTAATAGLCTEGTRMMTFTGTYLGVFAQNAIAYFKFFTAKERK